MGSSAISALTAFNSSMIGLIAALSSRCRSSSPSQVGHVGDELIVSFFPET